MPAGPASAGPQRQPWPGSSGDIEQEYRALTTACAVVDRSGRARIRHSGKDVLDLLHRLSTNDLLELEAGDAAGTVLTSERGRIVDVLTVVRRAGDDLLLMSGAPSAAPAIEWIDRFTFEEDARLEDISATTAQIAMAGPAAAGAVRRTAGELAASLDTGRSATAEAGGARVDIVRTDALGVPCWEIVVAASARDAVIEAATKAGASLAREAAWDAVRIERGVPAYGHELTDEANPLEAGLKHLVSFTKGCYVGQEVVARLDTYDKVRRALACLLSDAPLRPGELLSAGGQEAGNVTSAAWSPGLRRHIGLGYVRNAFAAPGTRLLASSGPVTVAALPMVS